MAFNFLTCEASAVIKLQLDLSYQANNGQITHKTVLVDTDKVYQIQVADNMAGLTTYVGRIISFTLGTTREVLAYVSQDTKPTMVDTITIDCSGEGASTIKVVNVVDIRNIEEQFTGMEEIVSDNIVTFK